MYPNIMRPVPFNKHKIKHSANQEKCNEKIGGSEKKIEDKKEENGPQNNLNETDNNLMKEDNK